MSFLGLKPTFFKNGTSFSLHSSYLLKWQADQGKFHLFQHNIILCFKKHADISVPSVKLPCEQQASLMKIWRPICSFSPTLQHSLVLSIPLFPLIPLLHKPSSVLSRHFNDRAGGAAAQAATAQSRDPGQHSRTEHADTSWGHAPDCTSALPQSPPISYTVSGGFMLFISVTLPPLSLGWIQ